MKAEIDVNALNAAFQEAFPQAKELHLSKQEASQIKNIAGFAALDQLDDVANTFCEAWPRSKRFINVAMKGMAIFFPSQVGMAQGILTAIDQVVYPQVCQKD